MAVRSVREHQIVLSKGPEIYIFRFGPEDVTQIIDVVKEMAEDPNLGFDWEDAAILCWRMRGMLFKRV